MIRKMPGNGGDWVPESDPWDQKKPVEVPEYIKNDLESQWGIECCRLLEEVMGEDRRADFCDTSNTFYYNVTTLTPGSHYTIYNVLTGVAYGVSSGGQIHPAIGAQGKILDFNVAREEVEYDIVAIKGLIKKPLS